MLAEFKQYLQGQFPTLLDSKFIIAVSGGIDSVVLTHLCHQLQLDFALAHCNFQLRGSDSDQDETFVKKLASTLQVDVYSTSFETEFFAKDQKISIQEAARNLRYDWFYTLLENHSFDNVLTAHNLNDQLETFLFNFSRGTGLDGLTGIPSVNNKTLRPLLKFSRKQIEDFATQNKIDWREDISNTDTKYTRNKIRHQIVPLLEEINPQLLDSFQQTLENLNQSKQLVSDRIKNLSNELILEENTLIKLDINKLKKLSNPKAYLYEILNSYGFSEWNDVLHLLDAQSGKQVFSRTHRLVKDRECLMLTTLKEDAITSSKAYQIFDQDSEVKDPIHLTLELLKTESKDIENAILVDKDLLKYPLNVRKWQHGDYICPTGMKGRKKLSQLFKDHKLSLLEKEAIWVLANSENEIIWVIGLRQDRRFSASKRTQNILKITYHI